MVSSHVDIPEIVMLIGVNKIYWDIDLGVFGASPLQHYKTIMEEATSW